MMMENVTIHPSGQQTFDKESLPRFSMRVARYTHITSTMIAMSHSYK